MGGRRADGGRCLSRLRRWLLHLGAGDGLGCHHSLSSRWVLGSGVEGGFGGFTLAAEPPAGSCCCCALAGGSGSAGALAFA